MKLSGGMLGLRHADGNILFGDGNDYRAIYRLGNVSYEFLTERGKQDVVAALMIALMEIGDDASLMRVCRHYPPDRYVREGMRQLRKERPRDWEHAEPARWQWHLECHAALIGQARPQDTETYLIAKLPEDTTPGAVVAEAKRALWRISRKVETAAGVQTGSPLSAEEMYRIRSDEARLYERLREALYAVGVERAATQEIQWLLARGRCRGVGEPHLDEFWSPQAIVVKGDDGGVASYQPVTTLIDRAAKAVIRQHPRYLEVQGDDEDHGVSYQAALVLGALPEEPPWPGPQCELMFAPLEQLPFPVDSVLHLRHTSNEKARRVVRTKTLEADVTAREEEQGVLGATWASMENREIARELQAYLERQDHPPMLAGALQLMVGASTLEELEHRVDQIRHVYRPITVHQPKWLQRRLYYEHTPRCGSAVAEWDDPLTVEQVGTMVPVAVSAVGSETGPYLGSTPLKARPVRFDVTEARRVSSGSAVLLAGGLGSGKTLSAESIATTALLSGSQVVDIDPKPDHGFHRYDPIRHLVNRWELTGDDTSRGALDPMRIPVPDSREEATMSYFGELLGDRFLAEPGVRPAIQTAIRDCMSASQWGSLAVIQRLRDAGGIAAKVADELAVYSDFGLARLAFGEALDDKLSVQARLTSVVAPNLTLPEAGTPRDQYNNREKISVATLGLLADMALRLVSGDKEQSKVILFDEAWFLLASAQGRALFSRLIRMGRAQNATIIIATQRLADLGDLENLIETFMIFGQRTEAEADHALRLLGLGDADEQMRSRIQSYKHGLCLMKDIHGRIAEVQVRMEPAMLRAYNTSVAETQPVAA